ncbi:MAG: phosphatase PAP2 family protein [Gloeobacteraceae cyanobacterium ES-bin-316]|nr:phosphatase PAP2 family protein [Ferruginibacter sp.]
MNKWVRRKASTVWDVLKVLSLEMIMIIAAFFSSLYLVVFVIRTVFVQKTNTLDDDVFLFFRTFTSPGLTSFMEVFTLLGSHYFLVPVNLGIIAYAYFIRRDGWFAIKTFAVAFSSLILMFGLKMLFNRSRPLTPLLREASGLSFPSGHAFMSFTFFGLLIYLVYNKVRNPFLRTLLIIFLLIVTFLVGVSRIYLRVHYVTDVLAGFALGVMWLVISIWLLNVIEKNKSKLPPVE